MKEKQIHHQTNLAPCLICLNHHLTDLTPICSQKNIAIPVVPQQGGGGSFKNRKPIGEVGGCESGMAERSH